MGFSVPFRMGHSGNPKGRPPGGTSLAERIRAKCGHDGATLVDLLYGIAADEEQPTRLRIDAAKVLLERGFGKPPQEVHVKTGGLSDVTPEQVQRMGDADLKRFLALTTEACELVEGAQRGARPLTSTNAP